MNTTPPLGGTRSIRASPSTCFNRNCSSLDLIVAVGSALEAVWKSRILVEWEGHSVPVVSRDGLLTMKRLANRPKDQLDIAALEGTDDER